MFHTIVGDDWDALPYISNGWRIVSKHPLLRGGWMYELKLE